ncbi:hypothetical protein JG688_00001030 [Phytophthora aleatoria]|uniref:Uncharacterized protein n=1 Tax=Phytophthora aleatoria TaxID=2496075 RepID=A0A8J5M9U6_9STRA|nr:hypothetical protein JG688_00001030 [Phytophthora aleatoria]
MCTPRFKLPCAASGPLSGIRARKKLLADDVHLGVPKIYTRASPNRFKMHALDQPQSLQDACT